MGIVGVTFSFMPDEILAFIHEGSSPLFVPVLKVVGALYYGFAMINWMSKGVIMGGIYARPLAVGNLAHYFIGAMALIRHFDNADAYGAVYYAVTAIYILFAIFFGIAVFTHPLKQTNGTAI